MSGTSRCRSCGAPVVWRRHRVTGKPMPLNAEPTPDGDFVLDADGEHYHAAEPETTLARHLSHFATCPQSREWRKPVAYTGGFVR
jgi:hypothetical protein